MAPRLRRPVGLTLGTDGRFTCAGPAGQPVALSRELVDLLGAIGEGAELDGWARAQRINAETLAVCLEQLAALGLVTTEDAPAGGTAPVFVLSAMRSGSTLMRYLLDAHPAIACPPESKFLGGIEAFLDYPDMQIALASLGFTPEAQHGAMREVAERVLGGYARRRNKRRWADKTPQYYRLVDLIEALFGGEALYVCLVRHPLDNVASLEEMWRGHGGLERHPDLSRWVAVHGRGRLAFAQYWRAVNETILACARARPARSLLVRYENLVADPQATMDTVFRFLGEAPVHGIVERAFASEHTPGFQDHKIIRTRGVETGSVGRWRDWEAGEIAALARHVGPLAEALGYPPLGMGGAW